MNIATPIMIFVWIFIVIILAMVFNTAIMGFVKPVFSDAAHNLTFVNETRYEAKESMIVNVFYIVIAITVITPFAYILVRLFFKKEPEAYNRGFN